MKRRVAAFIVAFASVLLVYGILQAFSGGGRDRGDHRNAEHSAKDRAEKNRAAKDQAPDYQYFHYYSNLHPTSVSLP